MASKETETANVLSRLIELDFDALHAFDAALERVRDGEIRDALADFRADHVRHIQELAATVRALGDQPPEHGDFKGMLDKGRVAIATLGGDRAILSALCSNAQQITAAYADAAGEPGFDEAVHVMLSIALADVRRHQAWLDAKLRTL